MSKKSSVFMQGARTLFENASRTPELAKALAVYGYTEAVFKADIELLNEVEALMQKKSMEEGEKIEATADFASAWREANVTYIKTLKIARIALADDEKCGSGLMLSGVRKQTFSGWCLQSVTFYTNLLADKKLVAKMARFGYTMESLTKEKKQIDATAARYQRHAVQSGEAKAATQLKDREMARLDDRVSELRAVSEVAFYDDRVQLEKLGPLAPTFNRRATKKKPLVTV